jgi:hypothetical protein
MFGFKKKKKIEAGDLIISQEGSFRVKGVNKRFVAIESIINGGQFSSLNIKSFKYAAIWCETSWYLNFIAMRLYDAKMSNSH